MYVGDAQDAKDDAVRASASGRNFFFRNARYSVSLFVQMLTVVPFPWISKTP